MATTKGRIEGLITVPSGGWDMAVTDSGTSGTATLAAGDYYLSSDGGAGASLIATLQSTLQAFGSGDSWSVTLSAGESGTGLVSIDNDTYSNWSIVWTDTELRDLLGYTGNIGAEDQAADFDTADYAFRATPGFTFSTNLTVCFWIRFNATPGGGRLISGWTDNSTDKSFFLDWLTTDGGNVRLVVSDNGTTEKQARMLLPAVAGTWYHVAYTFDAALGVDFDTQTTGYVNGVDTTLDTFSGASIASINNSAANFEIGDITANSGTAFDGQIANYRIFSKTLTAAEVAAEMASATAVITDSTLVADWPLIADLNDDSSNAEHLTDGGTITFVDGPFDSGPTGASQARSLWLPDGPMNPRHGSQTPIRETDGRINESPSGLVFGVYGQRKAIYAIEWIVTRAKTHIQGEQTTNESFERFWIDCLLGELTGSAFANPFRVYWDADDDATYATVRGAGELYQLFDPEKIRDDWTGLYRINLARLVEVPS